MRGAHRKPAAGRRGCRYRVRFVVAGFAGAATVLPLSLLSNSAGSLGRSSTSPTSRAASAQAAAPPGTFWMWSQGHLDALIAAGMSQAEALSFAGTPTSIFNLTVGHQDASHVASVKAAYPNARIDALFNSEADIANAFATNALPPGLSAIAYDPEGISQTPASEQGALGIGDTHYVAQAIALAHSHGLALYFIPSADVGMTGGQGGFPNKYSTWLSERRGNWAALGEDLYSIQSQQAEGTPTFATFVPAAIAQAHSAAPSVPTDVGIGINPHNPPTCITTQNILDAYNIAIQAGASGFWNNVESGVNCNVPDAVYTQFFNTLYSGSPPPPFVPPGPARATTGSPFAPVRLPAGRPASQASGPSGTLPGVLVPTTPAAGLSDIRLARALLAIHSTPSAIQQNSPVRGLGSSASGSGRATGGQPTAAARAAAVAPSMGPLLLAFGLSLVLGFILFTIALRAWLRAGRGVHSRARRSRRRSWVPSAPRAPA